MQSITHPNRPSSRALLLAAGLCATLLAAPAVHAEANWGNDSDNSSSLHWDPTHTEERGTGRIDGLPNPQARVERRLQRLRADLQIQPAQEAAWAAFASAAQTHTRAMVQERQRMGAAVTLPERMQQRQRLEDVRAQSRTPVRLALLELYQILTPQQRVQLDRLGMGRRV